MPGFWPTNLYGPAPIGAFLKASSPTCSTYFFGTIQPAPVSVAYEVRKSGQGCFNLKRTSRGDTISTDSTRDFNKSLPEPLYRSNENLTSSGVMGSPL